MEDTLLRELQINIDRIKMSFNNTADLVIREFRFGPKKEMTLKVVYLDGIIDTTLLQESVILPLIETLNINKTQSQELINHVSNTILTTTNVKTTKSYQELLGAIIQGNAVLLFDGFHEVIIVEVTKWAERAVEESLGERSPKGAVLGFSEKAKTNINILRGIIKTEQFCVQRMTFGTMAKTDVFLLFINGIVDKGILKEVRNRIEKLDVKYVLEAKIVADIIEGKPKSFFPSTVSSDRPDSATSALFEGRVIVMVDGTPQVIIAPSLFAELFQAPDEYHVSYGRFSIRLLRFFSFLIAVFLSSIYASLDKHGKDRIPKKLYEAFFTKDEILPTVWEVIILNVILALFIDASFRVPKSAIFLISIIGAILLGETAVAAKLIHPVGLIVVGISSISALVLANKGLLGAVRTLEVSFFVIGYFLGTNGMFIGVTLLIMYMISLKSIGVPYLSPFIPFRYKELKDTLFRGDLKKLTNSKHSFPDDN
ncbi:spore germination protein [Mesobacillus zeae]|uniref:Spore germination protein n=1 Tax=Mesobacillus zeae TaxID=1917180 RepID=A0A398B322_9BACI|nr:spore germination protein [Mesobacillus zeae]RID84287.1 spore germination protein [Mesobacillus zeae]